MTPSKNYKLAFKIAGGVVPIVMTLLAAYMGNVTPVVHDVCEVILPSGMVNPLPVEADAGATR